MEQWVRVQNDHDRQVLAWLRDQVGDAAVAAAAQACGRGDSKPYLSTVCRQLGLPVPRFSRRVARTDGVGEGHLAAIYAILRAPSTRAHAR
jgi:hypothetical protein